MVGGGCVLIFAAVKKKARTRSIKNVANEDKSRNFFENGKQICRIYYFSIKKKNQSC